MISPTTLKRESDWNEGYKTAKNFSIDYAKKWGSSIPDYSRIFDFKEKSNSYINGFYEGVIYVRLNTKRPDQSKLESFVEAFVGAVVGFAFTTAISPLIYHICKVRMSTGQLGSVILLFTIVTIFRTYILRRFFNNLSGIKIFIINKLKPLLKK
jgi:hypothetical protein